MDRRSVKTLLILLLLVTDLFLAGLWLSRQQRMYARQRDMDTELERVLAEAGLTVSRENLPEQSAHILQFTRDREKERAAAETLLGPCQAEELGGGITEYRSERGHARFRGLGEFEIALTQPLPLHRPEEDLSELAQNMGFSPAGQEEPGLEPTESGYAVSEQTQSYPIWDGCARFHVEEGRLTGVEGQWLLGDGYIRRDTVSRSAGWAMLSLARSLANTEGGELVDMELGYRLSALSPEMLRLTPCWRITLSGSENDRRVYYVNAVTGVPEPL